MTEAEAARTVADELRAYYRRWEDGSYTKQFPHGIEPINKGHSLHTAVIALEDFQEERGPKKLKPLPHPVIECWRSLLISSRRHRFAAIWWADAMESAVFNVWLEQSEHFGSTADVYLRTKSAREQDQADRYDAVVGDVAKIRDLLEAGRIDNPPSPAV